MAELKRCDKCGEVKPRSDIESRYTRESPTFKMHGDQWDSRRVSITITYESLWPNKAKPDLCQACVEELWGPVVRQPELG